VELGCKENFIEQKQIQAISRENDKQNEEERGNSIAETINGFPSSNPKKV
jgi:hypothetical protein